jgi:hypothetical protein
VLRLAVGDTLDAPNRSAFPKNHLALIDEPRGQEMFDLAHRLLGEMGDATGIEIYKTLGAKPHKFVHGYGIFQYDLQFFLQDPDYFLEQRWQHIDAAVGKMMAELTHAASRLGFAGREELTDLESCFVAICYNTGFGNFKASRGLKQGHSDGTHFYGENIARYIKIAHDIPLATPGTVPVVAVVGGTSGPVPAKAPAAPSVVGIAQAEFDKFNGIDEGTQPLRARIADYYEAGGGSRKLDPTKNENAWSAAFISFCIKQSGATASQFKFSLSHSVFVRAAIANADAGTGLFRGHRVTDYAPKIGDLIHHNRNGGTLNYDFARKNSGYPSHSCIVVGFEVRNGVRNVVTIGGNEAIAHGGGTVGKKFFPLTGDGLLNQAAIGAKLICVVENLREVSAAPSAVVPKPFVVSVRTDLKLRGGPAPSFAIVKSLPNGTRLNVLEFVDGTDGKWALVDLEGDGIKDGFVFAKFIEPA